MVASAFPLSPDKQQYVQAMAGDIQVKLWERNSTMLCTFLFFSRSPSVFPSRSSFPLTVAMGVPSLTCWRPEAFWVLSLGIFAYIQ